MSRNRITSRENEASQIINAVNILEKSIKAVDENDLDNESDDIAKDDQEKVNESVPAGKADLKDEGDQNEKANDNWPVSEADKVKVASRLVSLARELLS